MLRIQQADAVWYVRHNLRRGTILSCAGGGLVVISSASLLAPDRGVLMWFLAGLIAAIGVGLFILGMLALRERVTFRISTRDDEVELTIRSGSDRRYRTRRTKVDRVQLELAPNATRTATDAWVVRISGFGDKMITLSKGDERDMKVLARQLATDLDADLEEPRGFTTRHDRS
ncbi:MAG: hypothetical protein HYY17_01005 [Planctomycetes bacterium]|nr:hypothetical protein [Planctomycetota bacterium]